jgi:molecular chaperone DnaK
MSYSLGVDLGTTFVGAAISRDTQVEMFTLGDRSVVAPAMVYLGADGTLVTGDAAGRRAASDPDRVGREFKRRLGDPTPVTLGGQPFPVTELLGALLRDTVTKISETEGAPPDRAVLTHPANWGSFRRGLFREVPGLAGLSDVLTITEPEAAAVHYAATRDLADGATVAVYDLGGGTFDATVLRNWSGRVEILGTPEGVDRLGGADFDDAILNYINRASNGAIDELDPRDPRAAVALGRLRQDCVLAKEALSVDTEAVIPVFLPGRQFDVRLTRAQFEDMIRAPIEATIGALARTVRSAQLSPDELSAVLLVGGSSRIPLVARLVSEHLGRPTVVDTQPKYAVALGAARLAGRRGRPATDRPAATVIGTRSSRTRAWRPRRVAALAGITGLAAAGVLTVFALRDPAPLTTEASPTPAAVAEARLGAMANSTEPAASVPVPSLGNPIAAGTTPSYVAVSPNGKLAYVANRDAKMISVVDTSTNQVTTRIPVAAGPPQFLAFAPDGRRAYVSIFNNARTIQAVGVLDTTTNEMVATIPVRTRPYLAAVSPDGNWLYVPNHDSGTVSVIDTATNRVTSEIKVKPNPHWVEFSRDGSRAYTANHESNLVSVIDTATRTVIAEVPVQASPHSLAVHPTRALVANTNYDANSVTMIDTTSNEVFATIKVGKNPQDITWSPDGRFAYTANGGDGTVSVIDAQSYTVTATVHTGQGPTSVAALPEGRDAYVTNLSGGTLRVLHIGG